MTARGTARLREPYRSVLQTGKGKTNENLDLQLSIAAFARARREPPDAELGQPDAGGPDGATLWRRYFRAAQ